MGAEWDLACRTCREYAWLGSVKPFKWDGFQIGNLAAAEIIAQHTHATCELVLDVDHAADVWSDSGKPLLGWRIDVRSHLEYEHSEGCSSCGAPVGGAVIAISEQLQFCSSSCRDNFVTQPHRVWRVVPPVEQVRVSCLRCNDEHTATVEGFVHLADWMSFHVGHPLSARTT
jgi:hypothetical protein